MGVPFMSRNKVLSNGSFTKSVMSTKAPFSPFSTHGGAEDQSFTILPNSPTNADSNYILSRDSVMASRQKNRRQIHSRSIATRPEPIQTDNLHNFSQINQT